MGQPAVVHVLPQQRQGELQQRQIARLVAHIVQDARHQTGLEGRPLQLGRLLDNRLQLGVVHGAQQQRSLLQRVSEGSMSQCLAHEVGAHGQEHHQRRGPAG